MVAPFTGDTRPADNRKLRFHDVSCGILFGIRAVASVSAPISGHCSGLQTPNPAAGRKPCPIAGSLSSLILE
jgi:hypothetical protein